MNIDIDGLQAFARIAELGTFSQAAEALFITPPALSRRIRKLEENLGVRLLDRTTRRVRLTPVGRDFLPQTRRLIEELERSLADLRDVAKHGAGQVTLACIPTAATYLLPAVIREYSLKFPHNRIRILDSRAHEAVQTVLRGEAEFGISLRGRDEQEIEFELLFDDPFVLACRRDHPLAKRKKVAWGELGKHRLISVGRLSGNYPALDFAPSSIAQGLYEVQQSFWTGLGMAEAGIGVIAVPGLALLRGRHPLLVSRPLVDPIVARTVGVVRRRGTTLSPAAEEFLALLRKRWTKAKTRPRSRGPAPRVCNGL